MTPLQIAREKVISASCALAGARISIDVSEPGPHDDATLELLDEILDQAIGEYAESRVKELINGEEGL